MMREGRITRMADGLFPLGDSHEELLRKYVETLERADKAGLTFKPSKTHISPRKSTIFGWSLEDGKWSPTPHVISSLTRASRPTTIKQMRSFCGAVKQLPPCLPKYAELLHPLEKIIGSKASAERVSWNDDLEKAFTNIKKAISKNAGRQILNLTKNFHPPLDPRLPPRQITTFPRQQPHVV